MEANAQHWEGLAHRNCTVVAALVTSETGLPIPFDPRPGAGGVAPIPYALNPNTRNSTL